jgi:hypothetical protein
MQYQANYCLLWYSGEEIITVTHEANFKKTLPQNMVFSGKLAFFQGAKLINSPPSITAFPLRYWLQTSPGRPTLPPCPHSGVVVFDGYS